SHPGDLPVRLRISPEVGDELEDLLWCRPDDDALTGLKRHCASPRSRSSHDEFAQHMMRPVSKATQTGSTKERLVRAAMRLFAERGYGRTTMGDIEEAAGFTRRGGTLYHYFSSKEAVLEAALERHTDAVADVGGLARLLPLPDRHSELLLLAKWLLGQLDRQ